MQRYYFILILPNNKETFFSVVSPSVKGRASRGLPLAAVLLSPMEREASSLAGKRCSLWGYYPIQ